MIGLDTNIIVRYLTQDDPVQSMKATQIIEGKLTEEQPGFISLVTMAETAWVLERTYHRSSQEIAKAIEAMLQADSLLIQNEQEVFTAMVALKTGQGGFADALIAALGQWAGCASTMTFDKRASRIDGFELA
jgi:predicted nucleic-acid-binding protein